MGVRAVLFVALLVLSGLAVPGTASATSVQVVCAGTQTDTFQPGLLLTPQSVSATINGILAPCTSSDRTITSGTYQQNFTAMLSCLNVFDGVAASRVLHWKTGESSTFSYNRVVNNVGGQATVTFTGTITSGRFAGATAVQQTIFITPNTLHCLTPPGLSELGPAVTVLTITTP